MSCFHRALASKLLEPTDTVKVGNPEMSSSASSEYPEISLE